VEWEKRGGCKGFAALADPHLRFLLRDCARLVRTIVFACPAPTEAVLLAADLSTSTVYILRPVGMVSSSKRVIEESLKLRREYNDGE
jgi:hypothetical protein